ncbi:hypothetical protein CVT24_004879 [Panaeolus cyanescens]|uniref:Uncharacterized protein n=1 Tax=Panaeolus cyanescens TaxID=181874 RepID=A0A409V9W9_9AGAR|nr:hypothetical protein CVT24_004879 [Panaeolus cyanescens]
MFDLSIEDQNTKRTQRYHAAETALAHSFTKCKDEDTIQELRITTLHKAFSVLNAHAVDARHSAEKLRTLLANREADPKEYQSLLQQRWREEKRSHAAEEVSQTLKKQISSPQTQPQPRSKSSEDNLVHFLTDSRHRIPLHLHHSAKHRSSRVDQSCSLQYPRRIVQKSLIPLSLKAPATKPQFLHSILTTKDVLSTTTTATETVSSPPTTPTLSMSPSPVPAASLSPMLDHTPQPPSPGPGTALIFREELPAPVLKPVGDLSITMPAYVADLLTEFDGNVGTGLPLQASFTNQPSTIHKSSSRNRMSAFIPESFATRFSSGDNSTPRKPKRMSMAPSSYVAPEPPMLPPIVIESDVLSMSTPSVSISQSAASQDIKDTSRAAQSNTAFARLRRKISALRQN